MAETRPDMKTLTDKVRSLAASCGFQKVGIAKAGELVKERRRLEEWLQRGFHGEMGWMERNPSMRTDPRELFEGAKSVVSVAMNYYHPNEHEGTPGTGKVSRYAWGDDYHDILKAALFRMLAELKEVSPGLKGKVCVDTSPIMDKAWAVKSGLGWIGKHTNLITTDFGSWIFLGELLLDQELIYDDEYREDHCGSCTACIDACPTDAIVGPYVVDSNKCISYATIELRADELPEKIANDLEGWVYGCDICQDVCPWNRFSQNSAEDAFAPRAGNVDTDLVEITEMDQEQFSKRFRGSPMKRTKLSGLRRNALALIERGGK